MYLSQILSVSLILFKGKEFLPYTCYFGNVSNISEIAEDYQCIFSFLIPCPDCHRHGELEGPFRSRLHFAAVETEP